MVDSQGTIVNRKPIISKQEVEKQSFWKPDAKLSSKVDSRLRVLESQRQLTSPGTLLSSALLEVMSGSLRPAELPGEGTSKGLPICQEPAWAPVPGVSKSRVHGSVLFSFLLLHNYHKLYGLKHCLSIITPFLLVTQHSWVPVFQVSGSWNKSIWSIKYIFTLIHAYILFNYLRLGYFDQGLSLGFCKCLLQ